MNRQQIMRLIILPMLLLLWGCQENSYNLQVRYADVLGLKQNDPVYFEHNRIGTVKKVFYTKQGDYLVEVSINPDFINVITEDSKFFIDTDPKERQSKTVTIVQERPGGKILTRNAIVQGSVKARFLDDMVREFMRNATLAENQMREVLQQLEEALQAASQKMSKEMADTIDDLSRQLQAFGEEMKKVPDREEVKQLEKSIKEFAAQLQKAEKDVSDHLRNELLPQLRKELEQLREQLQKEGRDKELDEIDKDVREMSNV